MKYSYKNNIMHLLKKVFFVTLIFSCFFLQIAKAENSSEVVITVNGNPITNLDIEHRIALLKLQHRQGDLKKIAQQELIEEKLKRLEAAHLKLTVSNQELDQAYAGFANQNQMSASEFSMLLNNIGVTSQHFQEYLRAQMEWGKVLSQRYHMEKTQKGAILSEEDTVQRLLKNKGTKPSVKEYKLQQITLLLPYKKRFQGLSEQYRNAAKIRANFKDCETTKDILKGMIDVSAKDIGRILEPQLPTAWEKVIKTTPKGKVTAPIRTEQGLEMFAVCDVRQVSDDRVAQLVFSIQNNSANGPTELKKLNDSYLKELHKNARIRYF